MGFKISFRGGSDFILEFSPLIQPAPMPTRIKPTWAEIVSLAENLKLGNKRVHASHLLIQKVWTNPEQVDGFAKMLLQLDEWKIEYTIEKPSDENCCYIRIPIKQDNILQVKSYSKIIVSF